MDSYRFGAGRYIQENNALDFCGEEIKRYGNKAYVIGGNTAIAVTEKRLCSSFEKYGLAYCMERFSGYPSVQKIEELKAEVMENDGDVLVGVGGGRIIDLAKKAAFELHIPVVSIPTQAATCAAYSPISVLYTPETKEFSSVVEKQKDNSILITNIRGKEDRALLIRLCKEFIYDCDGKILIGNGVKAEQNLSENKRLQQEVFELARNRAPGKHLYLIEQYYHELAISYISRKVGENGFKLKELEQIRCEDEETGRNLYETLYWYLRMKRNVSQTAAKLKIHRNTLLPRLTRLNDMLDLDNRDGAECEKLLVAMEIERMKNSDG